MQIVGGLVPGLFGMGPVIYKQVPISCTGFISCFFSLIILINYYSHDLDSAFFHTALFFIPSPHLSFFIS